MSQYLERLRLAAQTRQREADLARQKEEATQAAMKEAFAPFRKVWDELRNADVRYFDARAGRSVYLHESYPDRCYLYGYDPNIDVVFRVTPDLQLQMRLDPYENAINRLDTYDVKKLIECLMDMLAEIVTEVPDDRT